MAFLLQLDVEMIAVNRIENAKFILGAEQT